MQKPKPRLRGVAALLACLVLAAVFDSQLTAAGGGEQGVAAADQPSEEQLIRYALKHIERLGLLADAADIEDFLERYYLRVDRSGVSLDEDEWVVYVTDENRKEILDVQVTPSGRLSSFRYFWPNKLFRSPELAKDPSLSPQQAIREAIAAIKRVRGEFPPDLVPTLVQYNVPKQRQYRRIDIPHWRIWWRQKDGDVEYYRSGIYVAYSPHAGLLQYRDNYRGLKTRHKPRLTLDEAISRAKVILDKEIAGKQKPGWYFTKGRFYCVPSLQARVWKGPKDEGDFLVYEFKWYARRFKADGGAGLYPAGETILIDAVTGERVAKEDTLPSRD